MKGRSLQAPKTNGKEKQESEDKDFALKFL